MGLELAKGRKKGIDLAFLTGREVDCCRGPIKERTSITI